MSDIKVHYLRNKRYTGKSWAAVCGGEFEPIRTRPSYISTTWSRSADNFTTTFRRVTCVECLKFLAKKKALELEELQGVITKLEALPTYDLVPDNTNLLST